MLSCLAVSPRLRQTLCAARARELLSQFAKSTRDARLCTRAQSLIKALTPARRPARRASQTGDSPS